MVLKPQDAAQLQEYRSKVKDVDLQHICKVEEHEGMVFLAADDVQCSSCYLQTPVKVNKLKMVLFNLVSFVESCFPYK